MRLTREVIIPPAPAPIGWPLFAAMALLAALFAASRLTAAAHCTAPVMTIRTETLDLSSTSAVLSRCPRGAADGSLPRSTLFGAREP